MAALPGARFAVAPMIDWTDRYCRYFHRQLTARARLYTEMVVDEAILHGDQDRLLGFDAAEHPVALQIGGSDPEKLAPAARIGAARGYDEINLNVGCPSDRVQSGRFGACLMAEPGLVAEAVAAMREAVLSTVPVTVKCRIGIDDQDPQETLPAFLDAVVGAGADAVIVHARKAWLKGLSPKENRTIPPLDYDLVAQMAQAFPGVPFHLNGGIADLDQAEEILASGEFAGVMLGRAAYERPGLLAAVDARLFGEGAAQRTALEAVTATARHFEAEGVPVWRYARHMLGLFHGQSGARAWRRTLSAEARQPHADADWLIDLAASLSQKTPA